MIFSAFGMPILPIVPLGAEMLHFPDLISKLDDAYKVFGTNPNLRFYGWDERLCAGFEIWFRSSPEAQNAYKMLSIRAWRDFASAMNHLGRHDLRDKYNGYASAKIAELQTNNLYRSNQIQ